MADSNSVPHNPFPDRRSGKKFRYGDSSEREEADYPLSRREDDMSPEEVEAYLARQIELEESQGKTGGNSFRTDRGETPRKPVSAAVGGGKGNKFEKQARKPEDEYFASEGEAGETAQKFRRRRPDQDFPELRTLRRWSLISRWWMRSLGEGVYRFVTLDWNLEEGFAAMATWRPTQQTLWRFSTLTGAVSIILTLLLFWHYRQKPETELEGVNTLASAEAVPFEEEETILPTAPSELKQVSDDRPRYEEFAEETDQLAMNDAPHVFEDEPVVTPKKPVEPKPEPRVLMPEPVTIEPEPVQTDFEPPTPVRNHPEEFDSRDGVKASSTTLVESSEPPVPEKKAIFDDDEWGSGGKGFEDPEPVRRPLPEVTPVQDVKPIEKPVPQPVPDLPPAPAVAQRPEPVIPPASPIRQRIAISRSGSWANDQEGAAIYSMTIRNLESQELAELEIVESLPQGSKFLSASTRGVYDPNSHSVRWVISSLAGQGSSALSIRVKPMASQPNQPVQTSRVQVSDRRGVMENRSWQVDHTICSPTSASTSSQGIVPVGYYQDVAVPDYFFGW